MLYIFRAKIYIDQLFYNDLCYRYFREGYITIFTVDDIKAGCRVLSYQAIHKKEKMILCQMMNIYHHTEAIYHRFTYFYKTEICKKDDILSKLPQFSVNYNTNVNADRNSEYISFIFLDVLKLYEHLNIQENIVTKNEQNKCTPLK